MSRVDVIAAARTSRLDGKRAYRGRSWKHGSVHVVEGEVHGHVKPNGEMRARTTRARRQKPPDPPRSTKGPAAPRQMRALLSPAASAARHRRAPCHRLPCRLARGWRA